MQHQTHQITSVDHRIMTITLKSNTASIPITILATYAPQKGYKHEIRNHHWELAEQTIQNVPKTHLCMRCADANGKHGDRSKNSPELTKIIGMSTMAQQQEKAMGKHYEEYASIAT